MLKETTLLQHTMKIIIANGRFSRDAVKNLRYHMIYAIRVRFVQFFKAAMCVEDNAAVIHLHQLHKVTANHSLEHVRKVTENIIASAINTGSVVPLCDGLSYSVQVVSLSGRHVELLEALVGAEEVQLEHRKFVLEMSTVWNNTVVIPPDPSDDEELLRRCQHRHMHPVG